MGKIYLGIRSRMKLGRNPPGTVDNSRGSTQMSQTDMFTKIFRPGTSRLKVGSAHVPLDHFRIAHFGRAISSTHVGTARPNFTNVSQPRTPFVSSEFLSAWDLRIAKQFQQPVPTAALGMACVIFPACSAAAQLERQSHGHSKKGRSDFRLLQPWGSK